MPKKPKRKGIGGWSGATAKRQRIEVAKRREEESQEERDIRLQRERQNRQARLATETDEERNQRLETERERNQARLATETDEERNQRLENERERHQVRITEETVEERNRRTRTDRERHQEFRNTETQNETARRLRLDRMNHQLIRRRVISANVGEMSKVCPHCRAKRFVGETSNFCCMLGKVQIVTENALPNPLMSLFTDQTERSKEFRKNLRQYNCLFQMTSFGAKEAISPGWNPSMIIHGQIHHYIGSLTPDPEVQAKYIQIYFLDPNDSIELRMGILKNRGLQREIVQLLEETLRNINPYVASFIAAKEILRNLPEGKVVIDPDRRPNGENIRRFNGQIANEVAVIVPNNTEPFSTSRHIVLKEREGGVKIVSETHRAYDCLQYVLLFPRGDDGWHPELKMSNDKKLTPMRYYAHRIMVRENDDNIILRACRLFQQYVVDMAAKIESERLNYIRLNQVSLRSTTYKGLTDALNDNDSLENVGRRIILSSSFVGGPRYMMERCQDAMMYIRKFGTASLFITMTCNPNWPEIRQHLLYGQQPCDRPDLVARVFDLKRKIFIKHLTGPNGYFGKCIAWVSTVEYQKRGLPHIHFLLWLDETSKPRPNDFDEFVQAEVPDPQSDPELHTLVIKHMIHGPFCNATSPCWKDGHCSKRFPKAAQQETRCEEDAYPVYRRRSPEMGGFRGYQEKRELAVTSEWVVPYNGHLLKMFGCHLNVEICSSIKSIKYVIKYSLKGSDQAVFGVDDGDEIKQYLTGRYIGPSEAVASILGFPIHERNPTVVRLPVHLPQEQLVVVRSNTNADDLNNQLETKNTKLTAFFKLCTQDVFAETLIYSEVPIFYTWTNNNWQRRKSGQQNENYPNIYKSDALGRIYTVSPKCGDLFYLRLLLHHVKGPKSFDYLKSHNGHIQNSFKDVCQAMGLLISDDHWRHTMEDARQTKLPKATRDLFVLLLTNVDVMDPVHLWDEFKDAMSADYHRRDRTMGGDHIPDCQRHRDQALLYIADKLYTHNRTLGDFGLALPFPITACNTNVNQDIRREQLFDKQEQQLQVQHCLPLLNDDQRAVYQHVCCCLETGTPCMIFIDAPGGTGKTFLINLILSKVRGNGDVAVAVASSGIAATLMPGGRTAHSRFKIPINVTEDSICNFEKNSKTADFFREAKIIVWDECPMMRRECFETVDRTLRDVLSKNQPFGGILTVCCGDFRQLLPVVKRGNNAAIENACIKKSYLWRYFKHFHLSKNMRLSEGGEEYAQFLLNVGEDKIEKDCYGDISIPNDMILKVTSIEECIRHIYPSFDNPADLFSTHCILAPHNDTLRTINATCIRQFPGNMRVYKAINAVTDDTDAVHFPSEFLDSVEISGLPPNVLELKKGSPIILLRNLEPPKLCNGTRLIVEELYDNLIVAIINIGPFANETVMIPRLTINLTEGDTVPLRRSQFPVQLSFAMTIHKAQGQTLNNVLIYLKKPVFQHGQLYVALSRGRVKDNVKLYIPNSYKTSNVVIRRIL